jgi:hypothetical protein
MSEQKLIMPNATAYIRPHYVKDTANQLKHLLHHLRWSTDPELPDRLHCNMGADYLSSTGKFRQGKPFDASVLKVMNTINHDFNVGLNSCYAVYYQSGNAELPYRSNVEAQVELNHAAFSVSYGAPRYISFKDVETDQEFDFLLEDGGLLILPAQCLRNYMYAIKKSVQFTEPRLSLSFRQFNHSPFD